MVVVTIENEIVIFMVCSIVRRQGEGFKREGRVGKDCNLFPFLDQCYPISENTRDLKILNENILEAIKVYAS